MMKITYREALCLAQYNAMQEDPNVFLYGLDVGDHKDTFGSTKGIKAKFGQKRIFASPLSEDSLCGFGIGAAIAGLRPVNIHIRADFLLLCMNQLANIAGNISYFSNGKSKCPLTIRAIIGKSWGQGAQHSKEIYPLFKHIPGIKVIVPSTPQEAYSGLLMAIRDNNPVLCFEPRYLYENEGAVDTTVEIPLEKWKHLWCDHSPTPTARHLEKEYYLRRFGVDGDQMGKDFKGPF